MVVRFDRGWGDNGYDDSGPLGPGTRVIDNAPEVPDAGIPTAEHGVTVPKVYGTAMITSPLIVYQRQWNAGKAFKLAGTVGDQYDALSMSTVMALGEAPITGVRRFWNEGSAGFLGQDLDYCGIGQNRNANGSCTTTTIRFNTALTFPLTGTGSRVIFTSGTCQNQPRWVQSSTSTSITVTQAYSSAPADGDAFYVTDGYTVHTAEAPGTALPWLGTWNGAAYTGDAVGMGFGGTAYYACRSLAAKENGKLPSLKFEVQGSHIIDPNAPPLGDGNPNPVSLHADPADVVVDLLTSERFSVGLTVSQVEVEVGPDGLVSSGYRAYCSSMGFFVSRAITERASATDLLGSLLVCTNSVAVCTGGRIKIIPRGDTAVGTYIPPITAVVLDDHEILRDGSSDPVTIRRTPDQDVYNCWPVTILSRKADYEQSEYESEDTAHSAEYGQRRAGSVSLPWITEDTIALRLSSLMAQRSIYCRNTYRFKVKPKWVVLEPMDYVSISHRVGELSNILCRIVTIRRLANGALEIEAEEAPLGSAHPVDLTPATQDGYAEVAPAPKYISDPLTSIPPTVEVGSYTLRDTFYRALNGLANSGTGSLERVWFRGNVDSGTAGGAPNGTNWQVLPTYLAGNICALQIRLIPDNASSNLDSLRYAKLQLYAQSERGTGAGVTVTLAATHYQPVGDRTYRYPTNDAAPDNGTYSTATVAFTGTVTYPAVMMQLVNAFGASAGRCFYAGTTWVAGSALIDNGTSWPSGWGGSPPTPPPADGGGDPGTACCAPWTPIRMADGSWRCAGDLRVGDVLLTRPEGSNLYGVYLVTASSTHESERWAIISEDGRPFCFSPDHRVLAVDGLFRRVRDLAPGDVLAGPAPARVAQVGPLDAGPVVKLTVDGAHTYDSMGVISHNLKQL